LGTLSERLKLKEHHPEVKLSLTAALLRRALRLTNSLSVGPDSIAFYSGDDFLYLVGSLD